MMEMTSKKINSKKNEFEEKMSEIEECLQNINKTNNLSKILKGHDKIKVKINNIGEKLKQTKQHFETIKNSVVLEKIDDDTFEEFMEDINNEMTQDFNEIEIDILVCKYKKILEKIKSCEKYLKDKKMEVMYCKESDTGTENSSE